MSHTAYAYRAIDARNRAYRAAFNAEQDRVEAFRAQDRALVLDALSIEPRTEGQLSYLIATCPCVHPTARSIESGDRVRRVIAELVDGNRICVDGYSAGHPIYTLTNS